MYRAMFVIKLFLIYLLHAILPIVFVCYYSLVEFEDVSQSITSLATLFANDSSDFITSIQPDIANPMNLLVTTWHAVYTVPVDGSNSAAHIVGDMSKDGKIFVN